MEGGGLERTVSAVNLRRYVADLELDLDYATQIDECEDDVALANLCDVEGVAWRKVIEAAGASSALESLEEEKKAEEAKLLKLMADADESGLLDLGGVRQVMKGMGKDLSDDELREQMAEMDVDVDAGDVDFGEFLAWWQKLRTDECRRSLREHFLRKQKESEIRSLVDDLDLEGLKVHLLEQCCLEPLDANIRGEWRREADAELREVGPGSMTNRLSLCSRVRATDRVTLTTRRQERSTQALTWSFCSTSMRSSTSVRSLPPKACSRTSSRRQNATQQLLSPQPRRSTTQAVGSSSYRTTRHWVVTR